MRSKEKHPATSDEFGLITTSEDTQDGSGEGSAHSKAPDRDRDLHEPHKLLSTSTLRRVAVNFATAALSLYFIIFGILVALNDGKPAANMEEEALYNAAKAVRILPMTLHAYL
jgi:hypothetical protein